MKSPIRLSVREALALTDAEPLDARSPAEYAEDHWPGAFSAPVLDDAERAQIGTLHKQASPFDAARQGAGLICVNIGRLLHGALRDKPRDWRALVYCWRGGNRSHGLATVLAAVGWRTYVLDGGYRAFRRHVLDELARRPAELRFVVIAGPTGSAKTAVLHALAARGEQVLDLEAIGVHRGSVLGGVPGQAQPSQKAFETGIWDRLRRFDAARPVFVESESKKVGRCHVPDALMTAMRASACLRIDAEPALRATHLLSEYRHFISDRKKLTEQLECLSGLHGDAKVAGWLALADQGRWRQFVEALLIEHYDPAYQRSMARNFRVLHSAPVLSLNGADPASIEQLAAQAAALGWGQVSVDGGKSLEET